MSQIVSDWSSIVSESGVNATAGKEQIIWTFGLPDDLRTDHKTRLAVENGVHIIGIQELEWGMIERTDGNFNFDELDFVITTLYGKGLRLMLWLRPFFAYPNAINDFKIHNRINGGVLGMVNNFVDVNVPCSSTSFLPESSYERDINGVRIADNYAFNKRGSFSYADAGAVNRWLNFVARVVDFCNNHPLKSQVMEGIGIVDGTYAETGFITQEGYMRADAGYADVTIAGYRSYLNSRYGTIQALNTAWGTSYSVFDNINKGNMPKPNLIVNPDATDVDYGVSAGARDLFRYRVSLYSSLYNRFCAIVSNPSTQIAGLSSNTGFLKYCYLTENFTRGQGLSWGVSAFKTMYEPFNVFLSSVTAGNGASHAGSFLGDVILRSATVRGTFRERDFGMEWDGDPVNAEAAPSTLFLANKKWGSRLCVIALMGDENRWRDSVLGTMVDGSKEYRTFAKDIKYISDNFCGGSPVFPTPTQVFTYNESQTLQNPWNPNNAKSDWINASNILSNSAGNTNGFPVIQCIANL